MTYSLDNPQIPDNSDQILSSLHGRQRRKERGIAKESLEFAVKNGVKRKSDHRCGGWIFRCDTQGITVVTNRTCTKEITSWVNPCWGINLEKVQITKQMEDEHLQAMKDAKNHQNWESHRVVVVDQSGSMRNTDAENMATRSDLVWLCLAVDYIGKNLRSGEASCRDFLSLVRLGVEGDCLLTAQPFDWLLYNKIIDLLKDSQPLGDGNYLPALSTAEHLLKLNKNGKCHPQLIFITDGGPSDRQGMGFDRPEDYYKYVMSKRIGELASKFGSRLSFGVFLVCKDRNAVTSQMVSTAKEYSCQTYHVDFGLIPGALGSAFTTMSTLMASSKSRATDVYTNKLRTFRDDIIREPNTSIHIYLPNEPEWKKYYDIYCLKYDRKANELFAKEKWVVFDKNTSGIAIRDTFFAEGSERAVRRVRAVDRKGNFVGEPFVGKESLYDEDDADSISYHKTFLKVQTLAQKYAHLFNKAISRIPGYREECTPIIRFLEPTLIKYNQKNNKFQYLLVEQMLEHKKYQKWNSNNGFVDTSRNTNITIGSCSISVDEIPQAYSHFTYIASGNRFLVCDLQGVYDSDSYPPVFELTDPAIHYAEQTNRKDYGRTDLGQAGINKFLVTHKCTDLCKMSVSRWFKNNPLEMDVLCYKDLPEKKKDKEEIKYPVEEDDADTHIIKNKTLKNSVKFDLP